MRGAFASLRPVRARLGAAFGTGGLGVRMVCADLGEIAISDRRLGKRGTVGVGKDRSVGVLDD